MANLQGFPEYYEFDGCGITDVKTQIGNAIPPNVWKHYIRSCVTALEKFDAGLIDETGRAVDHTGTKAKALRGFATQSNTFTQSAKSSRMHSAHTSTFNIPSTRKNFSAPSNSTQPFFESTYSSQSSSTRSACLSSPVPAPSPSRAWSEESRTLSPEPLLLGIGPSAFKRETAPLRTRPSLFKRRYQMIDLTDDNNKKKKRACFDLTSDDWVMVDDM
jgi:C-5 cytosine-specific DNA methylase